MSEQKRGQLTDRIKERSIELLGYQITQSELRLLAYLDNVIKNQRTVDYRTLSREDIQDLESWSDKEYFDLVNGVVFKFSIEFYMIMSELLYLGYVDSE